MDTSASEYIAVPPFNNKRFAASRTTEKLKSDARNCTKHHPTEGRYHSGYLAAKRSYGKGDDTSNWQITQEPKQD